MTVPRVIAICLAAVLAAALPAAVSARDDLRIRVTVLPESTGSGEVTGPGLVCPGDCTAAVAEGGSYSMTGKPEAGSSLTWGGACEGVAPEQPCVLTPTRRTTQVTALFTRTGPGPGGDEAAPKTTITKAPKRKVRTKRSKARVRFEFASDEKGSTFECRLDKKPFVGCESPRTAKAAVGKHTFDVRATDRAGNTDGSPAHAAFKVVKKKKG